MEGFRKSLRRFVANRAAVASLAFLVLVSLLALFAPLVTSYSFEAQNLGERLVSPSWAHLMGTDSLGRDLYSRIVYGARVSMSVGIVTALVSVFFGAVYGAISGYAGGWVDAVMMRVVDVFYTFPSLLFAILVMVTMGSGITSIVVALAFVGWVNLARLVRGQVLQVKEMLHVEAARAMGVSSSRILVRHVFPLLWGPVIVALTFQIPTNIMSESFLSFIGLGLQPPTSSWGTLANEGWRAMRTFPHLIVFPGIVLFLTLLAFQFVGDGLRDVLDPKSRA
ncbi:MAG: ABC transporter permease [Deltaproteobacteria bacterium]|nr:ABC transporter permease [Deltaproteobacteria bacterium]